MQSYASRFGAILLILSFYDLLGILAWNARTGVDSNGAVILLFFFFPISIAVLCFPAGVASLAIKRVTKRAVYGALVAGLIVFLAAYVLLRLG